MISNKIKDNSLSVIGHNQLNGMIDALYTHLDIEVITKLRQVEVKFIEKLKPHIMNITSDEFYEDDQTKDLRVLLLKMEKVCQDINNY